MKPDIDKLLLKPLNRRREHALTRRRIREAVAAVDQVLASDQAMRTQRAAFDEARRIVAETAWKDPAAINAWLALVRSLFRSRRISWAHYVFSVGAAIEGVHESRWFDGAYDAELGALSRQLQELDEKPEFSQEDELEYSRLDAQYEQLLDAKLDETWREYDCADVAEIWRARRSEYDELRERGRRLVFHHDRPHHALRDVVEESYADARAAAAAGSYRAAVTLLGASLEGLLLLRCLRSRTRARRVAGTLPRRLRALAAKDLMSWSFETLIEVCDRAGWLPTLQSDLAVYAPSGFAHSIRGMRNWIHPAREAQERPWQGVFRPDYDLAHALYTLVAAAIQRPASAISRRRA